MAKRDSATYVFNQERRKTRKFLEEALDYINDHERWNGFSLNAHPLANKIAIYLNKPLTSPQNQV